MPSGAWAAGTVAWGDPVATGSGELEYTVTCTADASAATFPATASTNPIAGYVYMVTTNPGSPAPKDDYDITLTDSAGVDVMGGELIDRDTADSEQATPKIGNAYGSRRVNSTLTLNISGNDVNSAVTVLKIYVYQ